MYSIVVAVYNRPDEMGELLESLSTQTYTDFELVVVEDGSTTTSEAVCSRWSSALKINYLTKSNGGPAAARNFGCLHATGSVFIFLDSDCTVPQTWLEAIESGKTQQHLQAFGGPDREHPSFSTIQKAISYSMTSFFTTGGIRGSTIRTGGEFHPRSFNMGVDREAFERVKGFSAMRFGEDVDLSIRLLRSGIRVGLIPEAWVYHKRRTSFVKFYRQVFNSGDARINLSLRHPGTLKLTHFFPMAFALYALGAVICSLTVPNGWGALIPLCAYLCLIATHATLSQRSLHVGALSVVASSVQLFGYGLGFLRGLVVRSIGGRHDGHAFKETFYQ